MLESDYLYWKDASLNTLDYVVSKRCICQYIVDIVRTDFIITASVDGHVKFWKKQEEGIEFVKHFRAHLGTDNKTVTQNKTYCECL